MSRIEVVQDVRVRAVEHHARTLRAEVLHGAVPIARVSWSLPSEDEVGAHRETLDAWSAGGAALTFVRVGSTAALLDERELFRRALG